MYITKNGVHGTMYKYAVRYQDEHDEHNNGLWHCWAYDGEHAIEKFYTSEDADGWVVVGNPTRVKRTNERNPTHT